MKKKSRRQGELEEDSRVNTFGHSEPKLIGEYLSNLQEGKNENRQFWDMAKEIGAIRSHILLKKKKHYYFFIDTYALVQKYKDRIEWPHKQLYPKEQKPDIILTTSNQVSSIIARHWIKCFFSNSYHVIAEKHEANEYFVPDVRLKLRDQNILIVTDVTNTGNSLEGLLNLCDKKEFKPKTVKLCILINRLVGDDWARITRRIPENQINSIYRIPVPTFSNDWEKNCPLCREISFLQKHYQSLSFEARQYVDGRIEQIKEKEITDTKKVSIKSKQIDDKVARFKTLDFLLTKGKSGLFEAILNNVPLDDIYHSLEALPPEYGTHAKVKKWLSENIAKTIKIEHLRKLLNLSLLYNHQTLVDNIDHIILQFSKFEKDGFIVFLYNYLLCEKKIKESDLRRLLDKAPDENQVHKDFIIYFYTAIQTDMPKEIARRPSIIGLYEKVILKIANKNINVLITGESGTGKEVIAKLIHQLSGRNKENFVLINMSAIADTLMESELFGHVKGSFTGATTSRAGKLEYAKNGTAFFDEIGEVDLKLQLKLLNVLQDKKITRVGGTDPILCDFRAIFATNQNLIEMVKKKRFREDLYYRINVVHIKVPPLRHHPEDIELIADFFLDKFCNKFNMPKITNKTEVISRLKSYDWPGNIRELENVIELSVIMSEERIIDIKTLDKRLGRSMVSHVDTDKKNSLKENVIFYESQLIEEALKKNNGNVTQTAKKLGLGRPALYKKIQKYKSLKMID